MLIKVINPNTSPSFTERGRRAAEAVAAVGTRIIAGGPSIGVASVECHVDEAIATLGVINEVTAGERDGVDAYVIACFGDTGLAAAREVARGPVVGMTEAALFAACLVAHRFSIITLPRRTRIQSQRVLNDLGLTSGGRCAEIRAIDVPVLYDEDSEEAVYRSILSEAKEAIASDHAEAIVLGCAGLTDFVEPLTCELNIPVIDGVTMAVKLAEGLVTLGLCTSKQSSFGFPARATHLVLHEAEHAETTRGKSP